MSKPNVLPLVGVFLSLAYVGCADLSYTVPRNVLRDLSVEHKLTLFEAENEVAIAWDEREQALRKIQVLKAAKADAQAQLDGAYDDEERAQTKKVEKAELVAGAAIKAFSAKLELLDVLMDAARQRFRVKETIVTVALARFELAKATLVKKNSISGAEDVELEYFEKQVDKWVQRVREAQEDLAAIEKEAAEVKKVYLAQRDALDKTSGGGLGSPWVEDSTSWLDQ